MRVARHHWSAVAVGAVLLAALAGCDKVSHENLDKWRKTEHGPEKLVKALRSSSQDDDMRAHAAQNLVEIDQFGDVKDAFEDMDTGERSKVMAALAPRLWNDARITGDPNTISQIQTYAKDALFDLRGYADEKTRATIDADLLEWLTGGYFEIRAKSGRTQGEMIIRALGPGAAPKLLEAARAILVKPPDASGAHTQLGDSLLAALAYSGSPEAASFLVDLIEKDYKDESLPDRASAALSNAYVQPPSGQPVAGHGPLAPLVDRLVQIALDEKHAAPIRQDALLLVNAAGPPECINAFAQLAAVPTAAQQYRWMGLQYGLRCGGAAAMQPVLEAFPTVVSYERALYDKYAWKEIVAAPSGNKVAEQARQLLNSKSWFARVSAIEVLGMLPQTRNSADDAKRIRALAGDKTLLKGWWGAQEGAAKKKPDPTVGQVATEVAARMEGLAKGPETK